MKRILIGAALALSLLPGLASAATYSLTTTTQQEAAITDARTRYNNSLPQGQSDPGAFSANGPFLLNILTNAIQSWNNRPTQVQMDLSTKTAAIALLQADVARNDANSPTAQSLLNALQGAQ